MGSGLMASLGPQSCCINSTGGSEFSGGNGGEGGDGRHRPDEFHHSILPIGTLSTILASVSSFNSMYQDTLLIIHKSELFCLPCVASRPPDIAGMECWWQEEGGGRLVMKYYPTAPAISTPSLFTQINNKFLHQT